MLDDSFGNTNKISHRIRILLHFYNPMLHDTPNWETYFYCPRCWKATDGTSHSCTPKEVLDAITK